MYNHVNDRSGLEAPLIANDVYEIIMKNAVCLDSEIIYDRDFDYDYFGFKTLERSYLLKVHGKVVERPQHMLMRVAVGIHKNDIDSVLLEDFVKCHIYSHMSSLLRSIKSSGASSRHAKYFSWSYMVAGTFCFLPRVPKSMMIA
ncbi:ribonucleoside-diphosphate reductase large subunit-like [Rosa rugosa]|uniref:ribonucleoside-diphosphate reductase large subunit-like n=1 Tax=Rosa rugosa TaxID=74645 RepID=UPI002B4050D5|nr:ribonucleoside-diphosphate reductase large subunit-like [Rosa rugosa]